MAPKYARKALDEALASSHVDDEMLAVGLFAPKGSGVGMLAGGLVGDVVGGGLGGAVGSALGDLAGIGAGRKVAGDLHNLPVSRRRRRTGFRFGFWSFRLPATPKRSAWRETATR